MQWNKNDFGSRPEYVTGNMMEKALPYFEWTTEQMVSHISGHVLEVGSGVGNATPYIARCPNVQKCTAVDIDPHAHTIAAKQQNDRMEFICSDFHALPKNSFNSLVCANTIEHIEDDNEAVRAMYSLLRPGGTIALLMPAHQFLYSRYDHEAGHYRRYTKASMRALLQQSGFTIDEVFYFNMSAAVGWFLINRCLQKSGTNRSTFAGAAGLFAKYIMPANAWLERQIRPLFGLSVIGLATKPVTGNAATSGAHA
jgi:SAM-dependent methyltransferase